VPDEVIRVEGLSKMYKLGETNTGTLSHDLKRWWSKVSKNEDPYEKLAEVNDRSAKSSTGYVWSLKDINFSVERGEVFGIIGRNGAGKSTLLKLLSKITKPTKGSIKLGGRVASLLEVGTGFHPDLSGRENVFLNGAILGMRKQEIKSKFDEIVHFSGIERYIDTPVKRYSSGMFVRLAFAVAAHLEPEILIIDEVLAVGDAEFQQKCLGKIRDVSLNEGRTILFVSHNVAAVKRLCSRAMLLEKGETKKIDKVEKVLEAYQESENDVEQGVRNKLPESTAGCFLDWHIDGQVTTDRHSCYTRESFTITFRFQANTVIRNGEFHLLIRYNDDSILFHASSMDFSGKHFTLQPGIHRLSFNLALPVAHGKYDVEVGLFSAEKWVDHWITSTKLKVLETFEAHSSDDPFRGVLNLKTSFILDGMPEPVC
jgi:lipopolysaccharide transport system ATP-binding protein